MSSLHLVIADDSALLREGVAGLLERRGHRITGQASSAPELINLIEKQHAQGALPDVVITDVRMPPNMTSDGLRAAVKLRQSFPQLAIMVLSQFVAPTYAVELFDSAEAGTGYLLKDRVSEVAEFLTNLEVISKGGTVIDPQVARELIRIGRTGLSELTPRELEVLELMSRGQSNKEISANLVLSAAAVAKHVSNIFIKLGLSPEEDNRRVKAILEYLSAHR